MDNNIEIKAVGDAYEVREVITYTTNKQDLEQQLQQIKMNKRSIVEQMNRLKADYDRFCYREEQLQAVINENTIEEMPVIPEV